MNTKPTPAEGSAAPEGLRARKKRETRAALAAAALRLALEKGPDNVTVDEIAAAADVSVRTFFNYFAHKEDAILGRNPEHLELALRRIRESPDGQSPMTTIALVVCDILAELEAEGLPMSARGELVMQSPSLLAQMVLLGTEDERAMTAALAERLGEPPDALRPMLLVTAASTAGRVAFKLQLTNPDRALRSLMAEAFQYIATGLDPDFDQTVFDQTDQEGDS